MIYKDPRDQVVDDAAIKALTDAYGERVTSLPPVAIVIAAYNEAGAIGPVVEALPAEVCGQATATIVVADGCADSTVAEAAEAGAMVADVPVNRGQGAALRLGYRIAREGGAAYIITTDADGQYNPAEMATVLGPVVAGEGGLRDRLPAARQPGDQGHDPARRGQVLRQHDQPADRAEDQRHDVRPAGHALRGHRRRPARPAAVPGVRAADRRHHPRLQDRRGARDHPPAAGG
jgi:glycosyltransferase involved in cell wall biosynthesis